MGICLDGSKWRALNDSLDILLAFVSAWVLFWFLGSGCACGWFLGCCVVCGTFLFAVAVAVLSVCLVELAA